jgi:membrane-associated phospholipid phosphatase
MGRAAMITKEAQLQHLALSLLVFYLLYTLTNLYGAALYQLNPNHIHNLALPVDQTIFFIPAMIVPYSWSLLLFCASFFMVRTSQQLTLLTCRLILATLFATLIFYLYPARFSFIRPITSDWTQIGYQFLAVTDKPFNQFPSLHVSYALLLGVSLWRVVPASKAALQSIYRAALLTVCSLIILSTVFTYQHHVLDIVGGVGLATVVLWVANKLRNGLVLKYLTVAIAGFIMLAIAGFFLALNTGIVALQYIAIAFALYWLMSFLTVTWGYQNPNLARNQRWFSKDSLGQLTLGTWLRFAPLLMAYKIMAALGQWHTQRNKNVAAVPIPILTAKQPSDNTVVTIASARLATATLCEQLSYWQSLPDSGALPEVVSPSCQIIVVDLALELTSHYTALPTALPIIPTESKCSKPPQQLEQQSSCLRSFQSHYLYFPLLDLMPLSEIAVSDYLALFRQIDKLAGFDKEAEGKVAKDEVQQKNHDVDEIIIINFQCVMGFSRSVGLTVLYLVYCGKLTVGSYRAWLSQHYPRARLPEAYLPAALIVAITAVSSQ